MQVTLSDGTVLEPLTVTGETGHVQGASRDVLTFVFENTGLDELDGLFTAENCGRLILKEDDTEQEEPAYGEDGSQTGTATTTVPGAEYTHDGYTVRAALEKSAEKSGEKDADGADIYVTRVKIKMAQRTYTETQIMNLSSGLTDTQLALCEVYELMA